MEAKRASRFEILNPVSFIIRLAFESQDLDNFLSLEFRRELHVSLVFQPLDAGPMYWAPHLSFNILTSFCLCKINPGSSLFTGLVYIDGADSTVCFNLWKTIATFIEVNKKRQVHSIGNHSGSQSFSSEMVSKRAKEICTTKTKTGFVKFRPPWSIIGLHLDNVRHDAPGWSQIFPSWIMFKQVTATSMLYLKVTGRRTLPVWSRILPSLILFKEVTTTKDTYSLDNFLVEKSSIKQRIMALCWSGGIRMFH